jgi:hypothetical protein
MLEQFLNDLIGHHCVGVTRMASKMKCSHNYQIDLELVVRCYPERFRQIRSVSPRKMRFLAFVE